MPVNKETREMVARPELKDPLVQWDPADPSENVDVMDLQDPQESLVPMATPDLSDPLDP